MKVFIVIPVHNRRKFTRDCLLSLQQQSNENFQIIVVDDGSTDGTSEMIRQEFSDVVLLQDDGNLWWTGAINKGIRYALDTCNSGDFILVLNDDLVVSQNYISTFIELTAVFPNTLIGSVVVDIEDRETILSGGVKINWNTAKGVNLNAGKKLCSFPKGFSTDVSTLTGRGVLIPSNVFRKIGLYNEKHFLQCGDPELPVRAKRAGYRLLVSYDVPVYGCRNDLNHINHHEKYTLSDVKTYFFGIRSNMNLRYIFWFAYDTSPNIVKGTQYFIFKLARAIYHVLSRLELRKFS